MTPEQLFSLANDLALLSWILLAAFGWKRVVPTLITGAIVPLLLGLLYAILLAFHWKGSSGSFSTLGGVAQLFANRWLLLAGWVHYLAFDLFIGSWQVRDAARSGIKHWIVVPCLLLTFLFGPIGLLLYFVVRRSLLVRAT